MEVNLTIINLIIFARAIYVGYHVAAASAPRWRNGALHLVRRGHRYGMSPCRGIRVVAKARRGLIFSNRNVHV
jgi:hypothetical protein